MARYHINKKGEAGLCRATTGKCPFGGANVHYSSKEEARIGYEKTKVNIVIPNVNLEKKLDKAELLLIETSKKTLEGKLRDYFIALDSIKDKTNVEAYYAIPEGNMDTYENAWGTVRNITAILEKNKRELGLV